MGASPGRSANTLAARMSDRDTWDVFQRSGRGGLVVALKLWSRSDVRRRKGALVGLALLITLTGGVTLASLAGARRSATAFAEQLP